jgi:hypothetical protein
MKRGEMVRVAPGIYQNILKGLVKGKAKTSYTVIFHADGRQIWKRFPTKKAAEAFHDSVRTKVREGTYQAVEPLRGCPAGC